MKKGLKVLVLLLVVILITGCSFAKKENKDYSKTLATIFPDKVGTTAHYFGLAEYGHNVELTSVKKTDATVVYKIDGTMDDARGGDPDTRTFKVTYTVDHTSIKEVIVNNDELRAKGQDNRLNSIIPNQIILKLPLEVGTKWNQKFTYKKQEYTAATKITQIIEGTDGNKQYVTKTTVDDIDGFYNNQYYEIRTYEVGKGLIQFQNTMEMYDIDVDRELTAEDFLFGYTQGTLNIPKD